MIVLYETKRKENGGRIGKFFSNALPDPPPFYFSLFCVTLPVLLCHTIYVLLVHNVLAKKKENDTSLTPTYSSSQTS